MGWAEEKAIQMKEKKLHHRNYKVAIARLQSELAFCDLGEVVVFTGPSRMGKTSLLERLEREYLESSGSNVMKERPFVKLQVQNRSHDARFSLKAFYGDLLRTLQHPMFSPEVDEEHIRLQNIARVDRRSTRDLMLACEHSLRHLRTRFLAIDDAQHIEWHGPSAHVQGRILEAFKSFAASARLVLVVTGAYPVLRMMRASNHLVGRASTVEMPRYLETKADGAEFLKVLEWFSQGVKFEPGVTSLCDWAEYLYLHSLGVIGSLNRWLRSAFANMTAEGCDVLRWEHVDSARRNDEDLASIAAEIRLGEKLLKKSVAAHLMSGKPSEKKPRSKRRLKPFEIENRNFEKRFNK